MIQKAMVMLLAASFSTAAFGESALERHYSADFKQCIDQSDGGDYEIRECLNDENLMQDGRLNQAYTMVMRRLSASKQTGLRQSERAWIRQRDKTCNAQAAEEEGGTLYFVLYGYCVLDETIKRRLFLEGFK